MCHRPRSSIGFRALVYGTRGCGFEPRWGHLLFSPSSMCKPIPVTRGGENSINFPRKPCSGFSLLYPAAWVGISHAGQPWWGGSWPSFRSPNGRGMVLNINQCGFESCRKHDVRQKVTRKRTNTQIRWYRRPRAKQGENSDERKKKLRCLFLNQMLFRVCSRSSVESEPPVSTRLVVGSNPTGSTLEDWRSGRTYLS